MSYEKHLREGQWDRISGALPGKEGDVGRSSVDNRRFVELDWQKWGAMAIDAP